MSFDHHRFTLSFRQAMDYDIDYRDFEQVDMLPEGVPLLAYAGVWGDYSDIRCLFFDEDCNTYRRNIRRRGEGYMIGELDIDARALEVGQVVMA